MEFPSELLPQIQSNNAVLEMRWRCVCWVEKGNSLGDRISNCILRTVPEKADEYVSEFEPDDNIVLRL